MHLDLSPETQNQLAAMAAAAGFESVERFAAECLQQLATRETLEVVQAVRDGEAEYAAGGGRPAAEVVAEIREKLNLQ